VYQKEKPDLLSGLSKGHKTNVVTAFILCASAIYVKRSSRMSERFIKFIPSEEAFFLLVNHPKTFTLLTFIADRARREDGHPDGLKKGQCYLGDIKVMGLTEQNYRTAKGILVSRGHIKIVETSRTRKKSTNGSTTWGTLVELLTTTVYDINKSIDNDSSNERPTNDQRQTRRNKKEEDKEKINKKEKPAMIAFRDNVLLSQVEYDKLLGDHSREDVNSLLDILNNYKLSSGKKYASDYGAINVWVVKRLREEKAQKQKSGQVNYAEI
jgi:hypothetical protein